METSDYLISIKKICRASETDAEKLVYGTDASRIKGQAILVVWPENPEHLQRLIRFVTRKKASITIRGGGTGLVGSAVPQNSIVVDMSHFNKIKKINLGGETVTAEAGVVLDELNDVLEGYGYEFSCNPGSHAACTIGGMISTNAAGMLTSKHGRAADKVAEMNIMDGTGKIFTIKGEEISELAGTEGALSIILDAKLKIDKKKDLFNSVYEFENLTELLAKIDELKNDPEVEALEYINKTAAVIAGLDSRDYLLVKYSSPKGNTDKENSGEIWRLRENLYSVLVNAGFQRIEDPFIPEDSIGKFLLWLQNKNIPAYGHISSGILHPHFRRNTKDIDELAEITKQLKGRLAAEHGIGLLKKNFDSLFGAIKRIQNLKQKYDPFNILNRGKFK